MMTDGLAEAVQDPAVARTVSKVPLGISTFMIDGVASIDAGR